jgi:diaminohydroxyphosphoribosylaminopyrimidine deaminase/5-amino-6-(5-phosphoribosylamino)uracil reductase
VNPPADLAVATDLDRRFMAAAIALGRRHLGRTAPNPGVGAICVATTSAGPRVIGRGVTAVGGRPHAEPQALAQAGAAARGATLYVTLEPCSHWGRTPPCVDAILAAGIARVVVACDDPDPRVAGAGYARLREAGVVVVRGVCAEEATDGLAGFLTRTTQARPEVLLKLAVSADGAIGRRGVANFPITGPAARARAQILRAESDAVAVGAATAAIDDPELTVRLPGMASASPRRVVFDAAARLSPESRLARTARDVPVLLVVAADADADRLAALAEAGVATLRVDRDAAGRLDLAAALAGLAARDVNTLMVEGGAALAESFLAAGLVDRIALFTSPVVVGEGGVAAPPALAAALDPATGAFARRGRERLGDDLLEIWQATRAEAT